MAEAAPVVPCPACGAGLPARLTGVLESTPCPGCGRRTLVRAYPAFHAAAKPAAKAPAAQSGEASCFFHERLQAERSCETCGRFLCTNCTLHAASETLCPECMDMRFDPKTMKKAEGVARVAAPRSELVGCLVLSCFPVVGILGLALGCIVLVQDSKRRKAGFGMSPSWRTAGIVGLCIVAALQFLWLVTFE